MKKFLWLFPILILTACNSQAATTYLEERNANLQKEISNLHDNIASLEEEQSSLRDRMTELEEQLYIQVINYEKILDGFMRNLCDITGFLGVDELNIPF